MAKVSRTNLMKWIVFFGLLVISNVHARQPSQAAILSCILDRPVSRNVTLSNLPATEVKISDNYKANFNAMYYFKDGAVDIGYAEHGSRYGIIYAGSIYLLQSAIPLLGTKFSPTSFNPFFAIWRKVKDATGQYLCVVFPYGELGIKGRIDDVRGAYLLPIGAVSHSRKLYFTSSKVDPFQKTNPRIPRP